MNLSKKFEELIIKQLESFGCSMGVTHLVMYIASSKRGTKASFEMIGQWPQIDRLLLSIEDGTRFKKAIFYLVSLGWKRICRGEIGHYRLILD